MNYPLLKRRLSLLKYYLVAIVLIIVFLFPIYYIFTMAFKVNVDGSRLSAKMDFHSYIKKF